MCGWSFVIEQTFAAVPIIVLSSYNGNSSYSPSSSYSSPDYEFADFDQFVIHDSEVFLYESIEIFSVSNNAELRVSVLPNNARRYLAAPRIENYTVYVPVNGYEYIAYAGLLKDTRMKITINAKDPTRVRYSFARLDRGFFKDKYFVVSIRRTFSRAKRRFKRGFESLSFLLYCQLLLCCKPSHIFTRKHAKPQIPWLRV
jgi:hypothetical protein